MDNNSSTASEETIASEPSDTGVESEPEDSSGIPPQIQRTNTLPEYEDLTVQDNGEHRAVIEVYYKRYFAIILLSLIGIFGILVGSGLIPINAAETASTYGSLLLIPVLILLLFFDSQANS